LTDPRPELAELAIADPPERWRALGFSITADRLYLGGVAIQLGSDGSGITGWTLRHVDPGGEIDGLPTRVTTAGPSPPVAHPNGAVGLDHVVILTPDFDRTVVALAARAMPLRRVRELGDYRQGFRRLGPAVMEIVERRGGDDPDRGAGGARFWGLVVLVRDLDALHDRLAPHLGQPHPAVQPGRRIAGLAASAGLTPRVAFMDPE
jgi:hypothetical protein